MKGENGSLESGVWSLTNVVQLEVCSQIQTAEPALYKISTKSDLSDTD